MCWQCDHPGATWQDYLAHLRELLVRHCWVVQGVQRERHRAPYAYTIGLASHDQPELVITGLPYDRAADLLNGLAGQVLADGRCLQPGELVALPGGPAAEVVRVAEPAVHLAVAAALSRPGFAALQLVYADERGRWPWEAGFRGGRGGQPVLGGRDARSGRPAAAPGPDTPGVGSTA
jgi:hypothetical protein